MNMVKKICLYVAESRKGYDLPLDRKRYLVFDSFRGQIKSQKLHTQAANNGFFLVNKLAHYFQKSEFSQFYAAEVVKQSGSKGKNTCTGVYLSFIRMKENLKKNEIANFKLND